MGYTHYYNQRRDIAARTWSTICEDVAALLSYVENVQGVALRDWSGEGATRPEITAERIAFNGAGEDSHETFEIHRTRPPLDDWERRLGIKRGSTFCKTARKPYDIAVTACLCYLATIAETHTAASDGGGRDWLAGLELARQALPRYANQLDIPLGVLAEDRWCAPWPTVRSERYAFRFCVDGFAYITGPGGASYRFHSHHEAAQWAATWQETPIRVESRWSREPMQGGPLFDPTGVFDPRRWSALKRQQERVLRDMLDRAEGVRLTPPPALVRPDELPVMANSLANSLADLLKLAA